MESVDLVGPSVLDAAPTTALAADPGGPAVLCAGNVDDTAGRCAADSGDPAKDSADPTAACASGHAESSGTLDATHCSDPCSGSGDEDPVPLPRLLAEAEALFASEFDRRVRSSEFTNLSLAHARNVLRHLGEEPRRASAIVADCGVSKQALSQQIALLEHDGLLIVHADPRDARARLLTLTAKGVRAQHLVRRLFREIEDDWAADVGADDLSAIRRALRTLVARRRTSTC